MSQEYHSLLARTIAAVRRDPAQLRAVIYQFARVELRRHLFQNDSHVSLAEAKHHIAALEAAIKQVESETKDDLLLSSHDPSGQKAVATVEYGNADAPSTSPQLPERQKFTSEVLPPLGRKSPSPAPNRWLGPFEDEHEELVVLVSRSERIRSAFRSIVQLVMAATLAVAIFAGLQKESDLVSLAMRHIRFALGYPERPAPASAQQARSALNALGRGTQAVAGAPTQVDGVPLPRFFGVYAIARGQLVNLGTLPITVPDPRVQISALISSPSAATLPDGRLQFIAFRSDLANGAPDHTSVRVVARVMHALTFDKAGHAKTADVQGSWAVRGIAYQMRIAPVNGHPDMILIQPADPHFAFHVGRYALVLKNTAYDFSVAGPITDPAQCLERTDALDQPVYNECRSP